MAVEERDPHTGYLTTGHEWNGITELNRPVPKAVWLFLLATVAFSLLWWVLMPAWPLGETYTRGVLGANQHDRVAEDLAASAARRAAWTSQIETLSHDEIRSDAELMRAVRQTGETLFVDNCAVCHGTSAQGGPGFPDLTDEAWLWGGNADAIAETLRVGINARHPETRFAQMLAFGRDGLLDRQAVSDVVSYVQSLSAESAPEERSAERLAAGKEVFAQNCVSCHGPDGRGMEEVGAPDLTDDAWIYGGDRGAIFKSVHYGRQGVMPAWESRLPAAERKILTLYLLDLKTDRKP